MWFREVCSTALLGSTAILGGPGVANCAVDEFLLRHKPKVISHNLDKLHGNIILWLTLLQYHHGRATSNVSVMVDTSPLGYMRVAARRNVPITVHVSSDGFSWDCEPLHWICRGTYRGWRGAVKLHLPATRTSLCDESGMDRVPGWRSAA